MPRMSHHVALHVGDTQPSDLRVNWHPGSTGQHVQVVLDFDDRRVADIYAPSFDEVEAWALLIVAAVRAKRAEVEDGGT